MIGSDVASGYELRVLISSRQEMRFTAQFNSQIMNSHEKDTASSVVPQSVVWCHCYSLAMFCQYVHIIV